MDFLRALITAPVSIAVLFLLSKFIGNKQMSSLNLFDYINGITIGSIAAEMATAEMSDFWACLAALIVYVIIVMLCQAFFFFFLFFHYIHLRKLFIVGQFHLSAVLI